MAAQSGSEVPCRPVLDFYRVLLADSVRTLAYREALRRSVSSDEVVLDLGSGIGILAFFACEAGARRVFAVEMEHVADTAFLLARHLGYGERIEVFHGHSTKINLPERASILVTETLGVLGFDEGLLGSVIDARNRLLRPDATLIPRRVTASLVPVELPTEHGEHVAWWSERQYGFDFSPLRMFSSNVLYRAQIEPASFLSSPDQVIDLDLGTVARPAVSGSCSFLAERDGVLHGFGGWFTATLGPDLTLTNGPPDATHWGQAFLPFERPIAVARGARITVELESYDGQAWRWRGTVQSTVDVKFDQTTWLKSAPCRARQSRSWRKHRAIRSLARGWRRWTTRPLH